MRKKKKKKEIKSLEDIEVKLKKIGNIRPGVYLTFLYAFIVVVILFLVLLLPGLNNPGSKVTFLSLPKSAAVYVDDTYVGTTPCTEYLSKGRHSIRIGKLGFTYFEQTVSVDGRLFGSLIFPKKQSVSALLELTSPDKFLAKVHMDFAGWSAINAFHYRYQPELVISEAVAGIKRGNLNVPDDLLDSFFLSCLPYATDEVLLKDLIRGVVLSKTEGRALSPSTLLDTVSTILSACDAYPNFTSWLSAALSPETRALITKSNWYNSARVEYKAELQALSSARNTFDVEDSQTISIEGINFTFIEGGKYLIGRKGEDSFPLVFSTGPFYIADTEISYSQFATFLQERPAFHPNNVTELLQDGLITEDYCKDWDTHKDSDLPVTFVSYYVANEFCKWLNTKLPPFAREDFVVRLPDEYQWETAAHFSNTDNPVLHTENNPGPKPVNRRGNMHLNDFHGNVWEWCDNWFAGFDFVLFTTDGIKVPPATLFPGVEKAVRGGSWAVMEDLVDISSRGSQPPDWCTPFLGFRPAIVEK